MSDPFEPALLTVLYWFFVGTVVISGFAAYRLARWTRVSPPRRSAF